MIESIMSAIVALSVHGECLEADRYPQDPAEIARIDGYVTIDSCAIPTLPELSAGKICRIATILANSSEVRCNGGLGVDLL